MDVKVGDVFIDDFTYSCQVISSVIARVKYINENNIDFQPYCRSMWIYD